MDDLTGLWDIDEVLYHPELSNHLKIKFFEELFGEELNDDNVEYLFKKWRADNIKSSNVKRIMYNDETKEMYIEFQSKVIYTYFAVSFQLFLDVSGGKATCITSGVSKYGDWWVGKSPSVGAAVHKLLVKRGVTYQRGGSLK